MSLIRHASLRLGLCLCLGAALLAPADSGARSRRKRPPKPPPPARVELTYDEALDKLEDPKTWCEGAEALQRQAMQDALQPLLRAFARYEGERACLREAMAVLGSREVAWKLYDSAAGRRDGLLLMEALPDDQHL